MTSTRLLLSVALSALAPSVAAAQVDAPPAPADVVFAAFAIRM